MNIHGDESQGKDEQQQGDIHLPLAGLLPVEQKLVVNPSLRTVILLSTNAGGAQVVIDRQFSPNGIGVLLPILQTYPHYCSYEAILASLLHLSLGESRRLLQETREACIRTLRRSIGSIRAGLRDFGLKVHSLRGLGYILKAL
jgi:hypothetical protein